MDVAVAGDLVGTPRPPGIEARVGMSAARGNSRAGSQG